MQLLLRHGLSNLCHHTIQPSVIKSILHGTHENLCRVVRMFLYRSKMYSLSLLVIRRKRSWQLPGGRDKTTQPPRSLDSLVVRVCDWRLGYWMLPSDCGELWKRLRGSVVWASVWPFPVNRHFQWMKAMGSSHRRLSRYLGKGKLRWLSKTKSSNYFLL